LINDKIGENNYICHDFWHDEIKDFWVDDEIKLLNLL